MPGAQPLPKSEDPKGPCIQPRACAQNPFQGQESAEAEAEEPESCGLPTLRFKVQGHPILAGNCGLSFSMCPMVMTTVSILPRLLQQDQQSRAGRWDSGVIAND